MNGKNNAAWYLHQSSPSAVITTCLFYSPWLSSWCEGRPEAHSASLHWLEFPFRTSRGEPPAPQVLSLLPLCSFPLNLLPLSPCQPKSKVMLRQVDCRSHEGRRYWKEGSVIKVVKKRGFLFSLLISSLIKKTKTKLVVTVTRSQIFRRECTILWSPYNFDDDYPMTHFWIIKMETYYFS